METLKWEILEHEHKENEAGWFWALGIIAVSVSIASFIYGNILFAIFIIIAGITVGVYATKPPQMLHIEVSDKNISITGRVILFSELISFSIDRNKLIFEEKDWWKQLLIIPMHHEDIITVTNFLKNHLPEGKHREPLSHQIMEHLGV